MNTRRVIPAGVDREAWRALLRAGKKAHQRGDIVKAEAIAKLLQEAARKAKERSDAL